MTYRDYLAALIDEAHRRLSSPLDGDDIHELRLTCKRLQAAWQLHRTDQPKATVKMREETPKHIAKSLEGSREAAVRHAMLGWVMPRVTPPWRPVLARLRASLAAQAGQTEIDADRQALDTEFDQEWQHWEAEPLTPQRMRKGLKLTRKKARRLARRCAKSRDAEQCHRWRKWVKYLTYQQQMREQVEDKPAKEDPRQLKRLAKRLGRQHDLYNLTHWLASQSQEADVDESLLDEIRNLADRQLDKGLREGRKLGWL
ncbi:hypothetical protein GCM10027040_20280 [Halomonas shantousis]